MIEPIMYIGIGFLVAGLLVIGVIPMVHARAVRLTQRRLEAMTPLSMAEIQADKDQLRAEFAMSTRRLEMSVDQMKTKTTTQLAELGKKTDAISRLKLQLGEKAAAALAAEAQASGLTEELQAVRNELAAKVEALAARERGHAETSAELAKFSTQYHETSLTADSQRVELLALSAQTEVLKTQIDGYEKEVKDLQARLDAQAANAGEASRLLGEERTKTENYSARVAEIEHQLVVQTTEAEILGRRVQELLGRVDEQERSVAEREQAADQARSEAAAAHQLEANVRDALARHEAEHAALVETLTSEKSLAEEQAQGALQDRNRLLDEIGRMKREAESAWETERMESAVMRERINDVAAEVARLTAVLEGPNSPIDSILSGETARSAAAGGTDGRWTGENGANGAAKKSLADRIRALQSRAASMSQAG